MLGVMDGVALLISVGVSLGGCRDCVVGVRRPSDKGDNSAPMDGDTSANGRNPLPLCMSAAPPPPRAVRLPASRGVSLGVARPVFAALCGGARGVRLRGTVSTAPRRDMSASPV